MPLEERVGIASEYGTIPKVRAVVSLAYEGPALSASVHARLIKAYRDRDPITGTPMTRRVSGGGVLDLNVSRALTEHLRVTFGAFNLTNREPPFANSGGSLGYDNSQGTLEKRELSLSLGGRF